MTQNKLIAFCYLFIIGIALAMAFPLGSAAVAPLWLGTLALGLLTAGALHLARRRRPAAADEESPVPPPARFDALQVSAWASCSPPPSSSATPATIAMIQPPDQLVGRVRFEAGSVTWSPASPMSSTSFLKIKTLAPVEEDIELRLVGRLEALRPVRDDNGLPVLDADGRWNFTRTDMDQASDPSSSPPHARRSRTPGRPPFTHLDRVEPVNQPASGSLAILKPVNAVSLFARSGRNVVPVSILGRITADPWVYSFKTVLSITPDYIQYQPTAPSSPSIARPPASPSIPPCPATSASPAPPPTASMSP
jgi:hypothetical protein